MRSTVALFAATLALAGPAAAVPVSLTALPGITGGSPAATQVFRADLSIFTSGTVASVTVQDNSGGVGGSPGRFSGFDLDTLVLSSTFITDASQVATLVRAATFNFASAVLLAGSQRPPANPALFGTVAGGLDAAVATLDAFDANATTAIPGADGFISLGDNGILSLNLVTALALGGPLYLYIAEAGGNGEAAASNVSFSDLPIGVPEPATAALLGAGLIGALASRRHRHA